MHKLLNCLMALSFTACSSVQKTEYPPTASADTEVSKLGQEVEEAVSTQHDVLAPKEINKSQIHLKEARETLEKRGATRSFWKNLGYSRSYLEKAKDKYTLRRPYAEPVLQARQAALMAGARRFERSAKQLEELDDSFKVNASRLSENKMEREVWDRAKRNYEVLELQALQESQVGEARDLIEFARWRGARRYAPRTLALAEKAVKDADRAIAQNPYDHEMYAPLVVRANDVSRVLVAINATARKASTQSNEQLAREIVIRNRAIAGLYAELLNAEREAEKKSERY